MQVEQEVINDNTSSQTLVDIHAFSCLKCKVLGIDTLKTNRLPLMSKWPKWWKNEYDAIYVLVSLTLLWIDLGIEKHASAAFTS